VLVAESNSKKRKPCLRYRFRLYPHPHQEQALARLFGCCRSAWNDALRLRTARHRDGHNYGKDERGLLDKVCLTEAKTTDKPWLAEVNAQALQQSLRDLHQAISNHLSSLSGRRKGPKVKGPRLKKKRGAQSARFVANGFACNERTIRLSKIGLVPITWTRDLPSVPSSCTVIRDAAGRYFASFVCEIKPKPMPTLETEVGIDLGIAQFASFNTGERIKGPKPLKRNLQKLRRLQQALKRMDRNCTRTNPATGRRQRGSHRYHRQQRRIARVHAHIADVRKDFQEKLSTRLIHENQVIVLEDLRVSAMLKAPKPKLDEYAKRWLPNSRASKRGLARAIADAGWRSFRLMLEQKAERYGREIRVVNPAYTSQQCSCCGHIEKANRKTQADFRCVKCGHTENADINAAKNILAAGQVVRPSANCAESPERGSTKRTAEPMQKSRVRSRAAGCEASTHLKDQAHAA
jgi:putative transposase